MAVVDEAGSAVVAPKASRNRPLVRRILLGGALSVIAAGAIAVWLRPASAPVVRPERRTVLATVVTSGRVLPPTRTPLGVTFPSTVTDVLVEEGSPVEAGQALARLDDAEARARLHEAQAAVAQAEARLLGVRGASARLAGQRLRQALVEEQQALDHLQRTRRLGSSGAVPRAELDAADRTAELARIGVQQARTELEGSRPRGSESQLAAAQLAQAEAQLASARARLDRTVLRAPSAGVVAERAVDPGAVVQAGQTLLLFVADGPARLVVEPDEVNLSVLEPGQPALASAEAYPDRAFEAELYFVAPSVDPQRGTIEARLRVPDPPPYLRPDMTVSVEIEVGRSEQALVLPTSAVANLATERPWVLVVRDGRTEKRDVRIGLRGDEVVQILDGLARDDVVVARPSDVAAGTRVRATEQER